MSGTETALLTHLGPFEVETDLESVRSFAAAIARNGLTVPSRWTVPHTYPMRWLTLADIRSAVTVRCGSGPLLVQSLQVLTYHRPLQIAETYKLTLEISQAVRSSAALWLNALVHDRNDLLVLRMQTGLLQVTSLSRGPNGDKAH